MELKPLLKEWRIWVLGIALIVSTLMLFPHYDKRGGDIALVTNLENQTGIEISGGTKMILSLETNATGPELKQMASDTRDILQIRLSNSNLGDSSVRLLRFSDGWRIMVKVSNQNATRVQNLISREGSFQARMPFVVPERRTYELSSGSYTLIDRNSTLVVRQSGKTLANYSVGDEFNLGEVNITYTRYDEEGRIHIEALVYSGKDIESVPEAGSSSRASPRVYVRQGQPRFSFPVYISTEAAERRHQIFQNYEVGNGRLLNVSGGAALMSLYLDGKQQTTLAQSSGFKTGQPQERSIIQGGAQTRAEAKQQMSRLRAILKSGSLPAPVQTESISTLNPAYGEQFITVATISIVLSLVAVGFIIFVRYRDPRLAIPIVFTGAAEIYILLGTYFTTIGTLSLSAIAGIVAAIGTGVDDQIIITDESGKEQISSWSDRMKRAFFVIFTSAASTIGAMSPVIAPGLISILVGASGLGMIGYTVYTRGTNNHYLAIGAFAIAVSAMTMALGPAGAPLAPIHDFAFTTILGIMIGISITRPAFATVIEHIKN
ncbi:MAG: hypothetical protein ABEK01_05840 [Candidatus Nanohaloarchaea archaeon]